MKEDFSARLLRWFASNGRHDLPWQHPRSAYRVWVSEIMLQQTQVATVVGYFDRFVQRFPDLASLAAASLDEVLALWAGLGYYSRARNLHRAAGICVAQHDGQLPDRVDALRDLPGIGRSTAAAILAQAGGQRLAILDGNVKRVLSRHAGIAGYPGLPAIERQLWQEAEARLPPAALSQQMPDYTQALMDLGAGLCTRARPRCEHCPVQSDCVARRENRTAELPTRKAARAVPEKSVHLLLAIDAGGRVLLERRPPSGIWGGLWSLPEFAPAEPALTGSLLTNVESTGRALGLLLEPTRSLARIEHRFTHFLLHIEASVAAARPAPGLAAEPTDRAWVESGELARYGTPAPIRRLLEMQFRQ